MIQEHVAMGFNSRGSEAFCNSLGKPFCFNQRPTAAFEEYDGRVIRK